MVRIRWRELRLMCKDLGIKRPSIAIKMLIKDCIRKRSILGLDCNIPEVVDENGYNRDERDRSSTEVRHS